MASSSVTWEMEITHVEPDKFGGTEQWLFETECQCGLTVVGTDGLKMVQFMVKHQRSCPKIQEEGVDG